MCTSLQVAYARATKHPSSQSYFLRTIASTINTITITISTTTTITITIITSTIMIVTIIIINTIITVRCWRSCYERASLPTCWMSRSGNSIARIPSMVLVLR